MSEEKRTWWYAVAGEKKGPFTSAEMKGFATSGAINPNDLVWREGQPSWVKASQVKGLLPVEQQSASSPPPLPPIAAEPPTPSPSAPPPIAQSASALSDQEMLRLFVGEKFDSYYGKAWEKAAQPKQKSWIWAKRNNITNHWPAFFLTFLWMGYRKLYKEMAIGIAAYMVMFAIADYISEKMSRTLALGVSFYLLVYANSIYKTHVSASLKKISLLNISRKEKEEAIAKAGGTSWAGAFMALLAGIIAALASVGIASSLHINTGGLADDLSVIPSCGSELAISTLKDAFDSSQFAQNFHLLAVEIPGSSVKSVGDKCYASILLNNTETVKVEFFMKPSENRKFILQFEVKE